jgi:hypothetical protein
MQEEDMRHIWLGWAVAAGLATGAQAMQTGAALPAGIYQGGYVCPQGETALTLTVNEPADGQQTAEFAFGGNGGLPSGAYLVRVRIDGAGDVLLTPQQWLSKPDGYQMVGARLRHDGDQLSGAITNPGCRDVVLRRVGGS